MRRNRVGHRPASNGGPLMTDHFKLHDLDLELELLKRKREMIEQQQKMLANERELNTHKRQYTYNQRSNFSQQQQQYDDNQSYSDYYNAPSFSNSGSGLLGKRASNEPNWSANPPSKRFSGPQRGGGRKRFGADSGSDSSKPMSLLDQRIVPPLMQGQCSQQPSIGVWDNPPALMATKSVPPINRFYGQKPQKSHFKDFRHGKVTKNKPPPSSTVPKLVSYPIPMRKAIVEETSHLVQEVPKSNSAVLLADKVPTQQMAGRLELALGSILKDIKAKYSESTEHVVCFQSQFLLRHMKHAIRERLRRVMLGKVVGKLNEIVEQYRKVFPKDTDSEIVQIALDAQKAVKIKKQLGIKIEDADTAENYYKTNMNKLISVTLDEIFKKLFELYGDDNKESVQEEYSNIVVRQDNEDVKLEGDDENLNKDSKDETVIEEPKEADKDADNKDEESSPYDELDKELKRRIKKMDGVIISLMKRRLSMFLPKYKDYIIKLLNLNSMYQTTKEFILAKVQEKLTIDDRVEKSEKLNETNEDPNTPVRPAVATPPRILLPYYVKIYGRPALPKRKAMQAFLKEFNPKSIKKHRTMHLLFVGFDNKEDFDKIVAVKQNIIGNSTITIKVGEKAADLKPKEATDDDVQVVDNETKSADDIQIIDEDKAENTSINSDLDDQITNLLSSIRKDEEQIEVNNTNNKAEELPEKQVENVEVIEEDTNVKDNDVVEDVKDNTNDVEDEKIDGDIEAIAEIANDVVADENMDEVTEINKEEYNGATETVQESENTETAGDVKEESIDKMETAADIAKEEESIDKVQTLKNEAKDPGTPTRSSTRIAASTIRTRRASKLLK